MVLGYLDSHGIEYRHFTHPAVFTCDEADKLEVYKDCKGLHAKTLFLRGKKKKDHFYLAIVPADNRVDMKQLGLFLGLPVQFGNADELKEILDLTPGSVSPFGLINDTTHKILKVLIWKAMWESDYVNFHPNINTETVELTQEMFRKFLDSIEHEVVVYDQS